MSNLENDKKMVDCHIIIKTIPIPHTNNWEQKKIAIDNSLNKLSEDFYKIINQIVDLGGIICLDKYKLDRDDVNKIAEANLYVKIPVSVLPIVQSLSNIQSCNIIQSKSQQ